MFDNYKSFVIYWFDNYNTEFMNVKPEIQTLKFVNLKFWFGNIKIRVSDLKIRFLDLNSKIQICWIFGEFRVFKSHYYHKLNTCLRGNSLRKRRRQRQGNEIYDAHRLCTFERVCVCVCMYIHACIIVQQNLNYVKLIRI